MNGPGGPESRVVAAAAAKRDPAQAGAPAGGGPDGRAVAQPDAQPVAQPDAQPDPQPETRPGGAGAAPWRVLTAAQWRLLEVPSGGTAVGGEVRDGVAAILQRLRSDGTAALLDLARSIDGVEARDADALEVPAAEVRAALEAIPAALREALETAAARVREFQVRTLPRPFRYDDGAGSAVSLECRPVTRAGVYAPGGRAAYPSSVLMTAVPARVAGVGEVVLCTPPRRDGPGRGSPDPAVLAAAAIAGVDRVFRLGGAHAVGAMAYGVAPVPRVDVLVGPGGRWVVEAKRQVFGAVGIESLAGPTEIAVVADDSADADWVAADLLAQAEHDPDVRAVLFTADARVAAAVTERLADRLQRAARRELAAAALARHGAAVVARDLAEAVELADAMAPEHLSLQCRDASAWAARIGRAGAVFIGPFAPVAAGDYAAGTNHVLPTAGTARFASALSALDFVRRVPVFGGAPAGTHAWAPAAERMAAAEGLMAHAESVALRRAAAPPPAPRRAPEPYVPSVPAGAARLDLNENPHDWPADLRERVLAHLRDIEPNRYPRASGDLQRAVARYAGVEADWVLVGNGSDDLILAAVGSLAPRLRRVLVPSPTFGMYRRVAEGLGVAVEAVPLGPAPGFALPVEALLRSAAGGGESLVFLCRPNNPPGNVWPEDEVLRLCRAEGVWTVVDEAYFEFCGQTLLPRLAELPRTVVLRTLSKAFAMAGLRVGYAVARPETLEPLRQVIQPWAVGVYAQGAAEVLLREGAWVADRVAAVRAERARLTAALGALPGLTPFPSEGNYVLFHVDPEATGWRAPELYGALAARGVVLRRWAAEPALADMLRVTVGQPAEDDRFLAEMADLLAGRAGGRRGTGA